VSLRTPYTDYLPTKQQITPSTKPAVAEIDPSQQAYYKAILKFEIAVFRYIDAKTK